MRGLSWPTWKKFNAVTVLLATALWSLEYWQGMRQVPFLAQGLAHSVEIFDTEDNVLQIIFVSKQQVYD